VDEAQVDDAIARSEVWIGERERCRYVAVTGMHGVMEAQHDPAFKDILNAADLVVPDGMPLVWIGRLRGLSLPRRVYGPEFMWCFCKQTASKGYRHFFYGGAPGVPERIAELFRREFHGLEVVGVSSPPFRPLTPAEDEEIVAMINRAGADILWVGLSTPKQEQWMYRHRGLLNVPVLVGVGAAFDIHSGVRRQAPAWVREHGLEWLFRLLQEPRRLWRRYLINGPQFALFVALELLQLKKFN
jgi:N-acetylglucosaminyldiphosphoundecaprenol N-acetyl-beta-D-mannosaminyltransferase